jgi:hypothetical protein
MLRQTTLVVRTAINASPLRPLTAEPGACLLELEACAWGAGDLRQRISMPQIDKFPPSLVMIISDELLFRVIEFTGLPFKTACPSAVHPDNFVYNNMDYD